MKNPFSRIFTCLFSNGDRASVTGYLVPVFGVPVYVEGGSIRNLRRLQRLTRKATQAAERLSGALMELDSVTHAQAFRNKELAEREPASNTAPAPN